MSNTNTTATNIIKAGSTVYEVRRADTDTPLMTVNRWAVKPMARPMRFRTRAAAEAAIRAMNTSRTLIVVEVTL